MTRVLRPYPKCRSRRHEDCWYDRQDGSLHRHSILLPRYFGLHEDQQGVAGEHLIGSRAGIWRVLDGASTSTHSFIHNCRRLSTGSCWTDHSATAPSCSSRAFFLFKTLTTFAAANFTHLLFAETPRLLLFPAQTLSKLAKTPDLPTTAETFSAQPRTHAGTLPEHSSLTCHSLCPSRHFDSKLYGGLPLNRLIYILLTLRHPEDRTLLRQHGLRPRICL